MGFIRDIENMPNEYAYSKLFFERWYRPQNTTIVIAGDVTPEQVLPLVEKYWGGWKAGTGRRPRSRRSQRRRARMYVHVPWASDTLPFVTVAFRRRRSRKPARTRRPSTSSRRSTSGSTSELYKKLVVTEQKVDALIVDVPANVDPSLFTVFARVKNPADAVYVRDEILATIAAARSAAPPAARLADAKSYRSVRVRALAGQHGAHRDGRRGVRVVQAIVRHPEQLLSDARLADAGGPAGRRAEVLHRRRPDRHDAVDAAASPGIQHAPSIDSVKAAAAFTPAPARPRPRSCLLRREPPRAPASGCCSRSRSCRSSREDALHRRLRPRPGREGRARRADRRDDRRRRIPGDDDRANRSRALSDGRLVHRAGGQGDDGLHRHHRIGTTGRRFSARCCRSSSIRDFATRISSG